MGTTLASRFKNRRLALKLSQADLAEGICKQARISRIEKGNYSPGAELLYKLAKKMNVSVEYFFDDTVEEKSYTLEAFKEVVRKLLEQRDYTSLKYLYELELEKNKKITITDQAYLSWVESIILYHVDENKTKAVKILEETLTQVSEKDVLFLTLSNTLLNYLLEAENFEEYEKKYQKVNKILEKSQINTLEVVYTLIRFRYNYSFYLYSNKNNQKALEYIIETIDLCRKYKILYSLGDLYCLLGDVSEKFKEKEEVRKIYQKAIFYYKEEKNDKLALKVEQYIQDNYA